MFMLNYLIENVMLDFFQKSIKIVNIFLNIFLIKRFLIFSIKLEISVKDVYFI